MSSKQEGWGVLLLGPTMRRAVLADNGDVSYAGILKTHLPHPLFTHSAVEEAKMLICTVSCSQSWHNHRTGEPSVFCHLYPIRWKCRKINAVAVSSGALHTYMPPFSHHMYYSERVSDSVPDPHMVHRSCSNKPCQFCQSTFVLLKP